MGMSPTESGLGLLPMIVGLFIASIGSGQLVTRTGQVQDLPDRRLRPDDRRPCSCSPCWRWIRPTGSSAAYAFVFGFGLGLTMQTIVVAVQNAVQFRDMGVATSSTTFFRSLGGAIGAATFGAVLGSRLTTIWPSASRERRSWARPAAINTNDVQAIQALVEPRARPGLGGLHRRDQSTSSCSPSPSSCWP